MTDKTEMQGSVGVAIPRPAQPPEGIREFLHALQARNEKDNGLFPQVASEVEADAKALRRVLAVLDFYHPPRTSGVATSEGMSSEEALKRAGAAGLDPDPDVAGVTVPAEPDAWARTQWPEHQLHDNGSRWDKEKSHG